MCFAVTRRRLECCRNVTGTRRRECHGYVRVFDIVSSSAEAQTHNEKNDVAQYSWKKAPWADHRRLHNTARSSSSADFLFERHLCLLSCAVLRWPEATRKSRQRGRDPTLPKTVASYVFFMKTTKLHVVLARLRKTKSDAGMLMVYAPQCDNLISCSWTRACLQPYADL